MLAKSIYTLAIESSCDETSAAVLCNNKVLANFIATQKIHETFGGVVPELASRAHQQNIVPVVEGGKLRVHEGFPVCNSLRNPGSS
jgi:N6-L-threonylcarbamoyladenine synthase